MLTSGFIVNKLFSSLMLQKISYCICLWLAIPAWSNFFAEPALVECLSGAFLEGRLLALLENIKIDDIDFMGQCYKTFLFVIYKCL